MTLGQYCIIYNKYFTERECDAIQTAAETIELEEGRIGNGETDPDAPRDEASGTNDDFIRQSDVKWLMHHFLPEDISQKITDGINQANLDANWMFQWDHIENHQYTIYRHRPDAKVTGDFYTWHTDSGATAQSEGGRIRKISSTIQLSNPDENEGGHFQWIEPVGLFDKLKSTGVQTVNVDPYIQTAPFSAKERGSFIIFPSFVHHQVQPVTRGTRVSLVSWYHGQPYV